MAAIGPAVPVRQVANRRPSETSFSAFETYRARYGALSADASTPRSETSERSGLSELRHSPIGGTAANVSRQPTLEAGTGRGSSSNATTAQGASALSVFGGNFADYVSDAIIAALEKYDIYDLDDLANDDRLKLVAIYAFDLLPGSLRLVIKRVVGRDAFEAYLFDFLAYLRTRIPHERRRADLRVAVRELAHSPWLSQSMQAIISRSRAELSAVVSSYLPSNGLQLARAWTERVTGLVPLVPGQRVLPAPEVAPPSPALTQLAAALQ